MLAVVSGGNKNHYIISRDLDGTGLVALSAGLTLINKKSTSSYCFNSHQKNYHNEVCTPSDDRRIHEQLA